MPTTPPVIFWFRRDLRLTDNLGLHEASLTNQPILAVFVLEPHLLKISSVRRKFLYEGLVALHQDLQGHGGGLHLLHGSVEVALPRLIEQTGATALFYNKDYTPYATQRDQRIQARIGVPAYSFDDAIIQPPASVLTDAGQPYTVFTPFKNKWRSQVKQRTLLPLTHHIQLVNQPVLDLRQHLPHADMLERVVIPPAGEQIAQQRLTAFVEGGLYAYQTQRDRFDASPLNSNLSTSSLSPYFKFGMLSPRQALRTARHAYEQATHEGERKSVETWVDELIWREFYVHIMAQFPHTARRNFRPEYDYLEWNDNAVQLQQWQAGMSGYPIVDAAMRQLNQTGWMPNRARMVVASFLTKDLLMDWRTGASYFMEHLLDGDLCANTGGWQWSAGTGTDAQPYFRIFNPVSQSQKFDPQGAYIREWVPELDLLSGKELHAPWLAKRLIPNYPAPMVDHQQARQHTLQAFQRAREIFQQHKQKES